MRNGRVMLEFQHYPHFSSIYIVDCRALTPNVLIASAGDCPRLVAFNVGSFRHLSFKASLSEPLFVFASLAPARLKISIAL